MRTLKTVRALLLATLVALAFVSARAAEREALAHAPAGAATAATACMSGAPVC